jgi:hypothetical protein
VNKKQIIFSKDICFTNLIDNWSFKNKLVLLGTISRVSKNENKIKYVKVANLHNENNKTKY